MSNASRGAYFKARSRRWLEAHGWEVAEMEIVKWVMTPKGRLPIKRDQWGADLVAMSSTRLVFVQCKGGEQCRGNGQFPAAKRAFDAFRFPPFAERWIIAWAPRATMPRIIECSVEATQQAVQRTIEGSVHTA